MFNSDGVMDERFVLVACNGARVVVVDASSLSLLKEFPRQSPYLCFRLAPFATPPSSRYADAVALACDSTNRVVSVYHEDASFVHWVIPSSFTPSASNLQCDPNFPASSSKYSQTSPFTTPKIVNSEVCFKLLY